MKAYAIAFAALVAAIALRGALDPVMGDALPLVTLFGAVAAAVWVGGWIPAAIVGVLGYIVCNVLFIPPRGRVVLDTPNLVGMLAYVFTCALIIGIGEAMRRAQARANARGEILRVTLGSIGDAVITTDNEGRVAYMNAVAEALTGWARTDAMGRALDEVFRILNERTRQPSESPALRALREGAVVGLANHTLLVARDGTERAIDDSAAPIRDESGRVSGCVLIFRDVSERRRWEKDEAARMLGARLLASIVESSDDAIVSKTLDGVIQTWNAAAERTFGYPSAEAVGRHISLVIPPERLGEEDQIIASLRAGKRVDHFETERVRKDGRRIWVSLTISPIRDAGGQVVGASKIVRDVTRQRQAEERERELLAQAAEANAKFQAFFEQGALFAGLMDVDGTLVEANRLSWEACGWTRAQVVGAKFWDGPWWAPSPALVERIRAASLDAAAGRTFRTEMPYFVADGSRRMVDITILPIKDDSGRVRFLAPTGYDITERKRAEADRERFATLLENSRDFIGICDVAGVPLYVNPAGLAMVGLDDLEHARRVSVRDFFFPEDQSPIVDTFFPGVVATGHGEIDVRFRHFKTGAARWMAYKVLALKDANGEIVGFATVSQDVTERRRMEDDLRKLAADLSAADHRKNEFLATLSHELRNPLAPLSNMLEILKRGAGDADTRRRALDTMERQLGQLVRLVDDLLDLSRITHDRIELRRTRVDLAGVIQQAVQGCRPLAEAAGHTIDVALPAESIAVDGDPVRLTQVFGNLLSNSCKYTHAGGRIRVLAERRGGEAAVTIEDNGTGIPADKLHSIFEMFTQLDRTLEKSQGGLGIGLTLVKRLVEMHGGTVEAHSAGEGRGAQFVVRLPVAVARADAAPAAAVEGAPPHARTILIVDDNQDAATSLALLLEYAGHRTHVAHDGAAALEAMEAHRPDVVLLDLGLPTMNGYEVCRHARRQPWGEKMVVVALTGWGQAEDRNRSREAGFDTHMVKPVDHAALLELLRSLDSRQTTLSSPEEA